MSDKLQWMKRHLVLLRCVDLDDAVTNEKYECRSDLAKFYKEKSVQELIWNFADAGRYKCAIELMAHVGHHRAIIWWGYNCLMDLGDELKKNLTPVTNIDNIGKSFKPNIPEFSKVEAPQDSPEQIKEILEAQEQAKKAREELRSACNPEVIEKYEQYMELFYQEFEKQFGIRPLDLMDKLKDLILKEKTEGTIDMDSPIFKECEKVKTQLQKVRQETLDTIHAVVPPEIFEVKADKQVEATEAVYDWILAPDEINAKKCLEAGNKCPDLPAGILAYCAFWAWGDMMAGEKTDAIVKTPAGLLANGLSKFFLMCALRKGGTKSLKERYKTYFTLGAEVLTGEYLWDKSVISGQKPHEKLIEELIEELGQEKVFSSVKIQPDPLVKLKEKHVHPEKIERPVTPPPPPPPPPPPHQREIPAGAKKYTRWKPEIK